MIRKFAKQLDEWLKVALHDLPENLRNIKFECKYKSGELRGRENNILGPNSLTLVVHNNNNNNNFHLLFAKHQMLSLALFLHELPQCSQKVCYRWCPSPFMANEKA